MRQFLINAAAIGIVLAAMYMAGKPDSEGCYDNWRKCKDPHELVNQHSWSGPKVNCEFAANDLAKYGIPTWPGVPFGTYRFADDVLTTGRVTLVESDAQFSNIFGAMVHTAVSCDYDLAADKVLDVRILR